ncbi:methyl-accepting chemotaxis protein [Gracilibacillus halophilus YIM-C55.5]|uniref:Methyl-accepting chemotaxis protein n=2 Tax=Gracilibacillus TaxID=74385 RepID=N4WYS3_9BACI|nr:HAMP domain-containing methyl-accepting chemotaxis protein [Gracilibacillus halophilus]ENH98196.1 methyl-accepting chemotaxis protein [Gracilibacillus halophilus YIM-C55.5]
MRIFNFKSVRTKMITAFAAIILLVLVLGITTISFNKNTTDKMEDLTEKQLNLLIKDEQIALNMSQRTNLIRGFLLYEDKELRDKFEAGVDKSIALENELVELSDSEKVQKLIDKKVEWGKLTDQVFTAYDNGNKEKAMQIMRTEVQPLSDELINAFQERASEREGLIHEDGDEIINTSSVNNNISLVITILAVIVGMAIAITFSQSMMRQLKTVIGRMKDIADGDLTGEDLEPKTKDEIGDLVLATNDMNHNMRELLGKINSVSETVSSHSEELTQSANEVMSGTEKISSTMEEIASGSETQANNASELADNATNFSTKVDEANEDGELIYDASKQVLQMTNDGRQLMNKSVGQIQSIHEIVEQAVEKVKGLDEQSNQISKLVTVIKDIADQTNLLALNAAIEAARAGEHGEGFAVVADEVRKLAEQVSNSVTEITGIVGSIQSESSNVVESLQDGYSEVEKGANQIQSTEYTFETISIAIDEMASSIGFITENLVKMSQTSKNMNSSIEEIASVSEEAAAGVEETASASQQTSSTMQEVASSSEELSKLAEELNGLVRRFKL